MRSAPLRFGNSRVPARHAFHAATPFLNFVKCFFWLGIALIVDGVDGPLARKLDVKRWWPHW